MTRRGLRATFVQNEAVDCLVVSLPIAWNHCPYGPMEELL